MKKIFTTLFVFAFGLSISHAQSLSTDGVIPVIYGSPNDFSLVSTFSILNNTNNTLDIKVQRYDLSIVPGTDNTFCWDGTCFGNTTYISPNYASIPANSSNGTFIGDYYPYGISGVSTVGYKFYDMNNPNDSVYTAITYDATVTGINNTDPSSNFASVAPNPANSLAALNYRFKDAKGEIKIYDVLGNLVRNITPKGQSGTLILTVSDLKQGVYIVSMLSNGKSVANTKLVIQH